MDSSFDEEQKKSTRDFFEFYVGLIERRKELMKFNLAEDVVLDWFGQTVKGENNVCSFIKATVATTRHNFDEIKPASTIGYRETHVVGGRKYPAAPKKFIAASRNEDDTTPPKKVAAAASPAGTSQAAVERGQGDGLHNCDTPLSPSKRGRFDDGADADADEAPSVKYLCATGYIEFHKPSSKKLQKETRWERPCKLEIAYTTNGSPQDSVVHLIVYQGNMKCRRNLMKEFNSCEPQD